MTDRTVAVLARLAAELPTALAAAMLSDVVDLVADTELVGSVLAVAEGSDATAQPLTWPGTVTQTVPADPTVGEVLQRLPGSEAAAVVAPDVPDLPSLLLGKLFSALAGPRGSSVAVCPAEGGGLVAVAARAPISAWLVDSGVRLDDPDGLTVLRAAAPLGELSVGPGWHRIRSLADVERLDPGLEGWDATRVYLGR